MPRYVLSAETSFSAAHTLPGVGLCERLHGHNWRVRVNVSVEESDLDDGGMGIDFRIIEEVARATVADFEHRYLNDLEPFQGHLPTAERIARVVSDRAAGEFARCAPAVKVAEVEVWETTDYRVIYRRE